MPPERHMEGDEEAGFFDWEYGETGFEAGAYTRPLFSSTQALSMG